MTPARNSSSTGPNEISSWLTNSSRTWFWFDNGVDQRFLDPLKLWFAAYYYNRAAEWGKPVSIVTKKAAYAPSGVDTQEVGSIIDFEKIGSRSPAGIRTGVWEVHESIGSTWGYTSNMTVSPPAAVVSQLADTVSKNGNLFLNLSPMADGTIPEAQQNTLLEVGKWLEVNGDAIYGTHSWIKFGEGSQRGSTALNVRFTVKGDHLYAILLGNWPRRAGCHHFAGHRPGARWKNHLDHDAGQRRQAGVHPGC